MDVNGENLDSYATLVGIRIDGQRVIKGGTVSASSPSIVINANVTTSYGALTANAYTRLGERKSTQN